MVGTILVGTILVGTILVGTILVGTILVGTILVGRPIESIDDRLKTAVTYGRIVLLQLPAFVVVFVVT